MNLDPKNNETLNENLSYRNNPELHYMLKYLNLPIKMKIILIKRLDEVLSQKQEVASVEKDIANYAQYHIKGYDYDSIKSPHLLIHIEIKSHLHHASDTRFCLEKSKDFHNFKSIPYKPFDSVKIRDILYRTATRYMSSHECSEDELLFLAEDSKTLDQLQQDNPFIINVWQQTPLHLAVIDNNIEEIKNIITKDRNVIDMKDRWGSTALHYAVELALLDITKYLVKEEANVLERNNDGDTLMHLATIEGNEDMLCYLLSIGLDINARDNKLQTALHWTIMLNKKETMTYLIEKGARIDIADKGGRTALHIACQYENIEIELATYLIDRGADVNARDNILWTPLYWAILFKKSNLSGYLIEKGGGRVDIEDAEKRTPLHIAYRYDRYRGLLILNYMRVNNVNVNAQDSDGITALHISAYPLDYLDAKISMFYSNDLPSHDMKSLLERGANPNLMDRKGRKAIHYIRLDSEYNEYSDKYLDEVEKVIHYLLDYGTSLDNDVKYRKYNRALLYGVIKACSMKCFTRLLEVMNIDEYFSYKAYKKLLIKIQMHQGSGIESEEIKNYLWHKMNEAKKRERKNRKHEQGIDVDKGIVIAADFLTHLLSETDRKSNIWYVYLLEKVDKMNKFIREECSNGIIQEPLLHYITYYNFKFCYNVSQGWREAYERLAIMKEKLSSEEIFRVMIEFLDDERYDTEELIELLENMLQSFYKRESWKYFSGFIKAYDNENYDTDYYRNIKVREDIVKRNRYNELWKVWENSIKKAGEYIVKKVYSGNRYIWSPADKLNVNDEYDVIKDVKVLAEIKSENRIDVLKGEIKNIKNSMDSIEDSKEAKLEDIKLKENEIKEKEAKIQRLKESLRELKDIQQQMKEVT